MWPFSSNVKSLKSRELLWLVAKELWHGASQHLYADWRMRKEVCHSARYCKRDLVEEE